MTPSQQIESCREKLAALKGMIPIEAHRSRVIEIDRVMNDGLVWAQDNVKAAKLMKERTELAGMLEKLKGFEERVSFYSDYLGETNDEEGVKKEVGELLGEMGEVEFRLMMCGENDKLDALLSVNSGAGGLEASDFASMLMRMYVRYCEANGFKTEILDMQETEGGYIDSVSIRIEGDYAFGFLKGESGTHRLIRNSPFNSGNARHTSFAAVRVLPDIEDTIDIKINENDCEIYGQIGGGGPRSGGQ